MINFGEIMKILDGNDMKLIFSDYIVFIQIKGIPNDNYLPIEIFTSIKNKTHWLKLIIYKIVYEYNLLVQEILIE